MEQKPKRQLDLLQRQWNKGEKGGECGGRVIMPGELLKLLSERQATLQRKSTHECERMASETPEERQTRLHWMRNRLASETPEERQTRLQWMRYRRASEPPEERQTRIKAETPKERETRLQQMSTNQHKRWQLKLLRRDNSD